MNTLYQPSPEALVAWLLDDSGVGLNAFGRVTALLNFTAGVRNLASAVKTAPTSLVVTSRRFIDQAKLEDVIEGLAATEVAPDVLIAAMASSSISKTLVCDVPLLGSFTALLLMLSKTCVPVWAITMVRAESTC